MEARVTPPPRSSAAASSPPLHAGIERLIVVAPSWVGDSVMATPLLRALRQHLSATRINLVVRPGIDALLAGLPFFDEMIVDHNKGVLGPPKLAKRLASLKADAALLLPNSFRSAASVRLAGIPIRIGYDRDARGKLLTHAVTPPSQTPIALLEYYERLACAALGIEQIDRAMQLAITPAQQSRADAILADVPRPFVLLNPGANRVDKRWPAASFAKLADALAANPGVAVALSGSPSESSLLDEIASLATSPLLNLADRNTDLGCLKPIIRAAALMITNDTGPRHIAAALGTPLITLFGPTDHRWTTLGLANETILLADPFLPEELTTDDHPTRCAIDKISVSEVIAAARRHLAGVADQTPPPAPSP